MTIKLCLIPKEDAAIPSNLGSTYVMAHESEWIDASDFSTFITVGYVKGVDFVYHEGKTYFIKKSFVIPNKKTVVLMCDESINGCDN